MKRRRLKIKCKTTLTLMESLLSDKKFKVSLNGEVSQMKSLRNGLLQGSVISAILFNECLHNRYFKIK